MILFKASLSLGIELASSLAQLGANFLSPAVSIRATGLPTELQGYDCNLQREQTLAEAKSLGSCVAP